MKSKIIKVGQKSLTLKVVRGEVTSNNKWSETHVKSHGGGGFVSPQGGYIAAPQISSHVSTHRDVWVNDADTGSAASLKLPGDVPVADGHNVVFIEARYDGNVLIPYFENINSQKYWELVNMQQFFGQITRKPILFWAIFWLLASWLGLVAAILYVGEKVAQQHDSALLYAIFVSVGLVTLNAVWTAIRNAKARNEKLAEYKAFFKDAISQQ